MSRSLSSIVGGLSLFTNASVVFAITLSTPDPRLAISADVASPKTGIAFTSSSQNFPPVDDGQDTVPHDSGGC